MKLVAILLCSTIIIIELQHHLDAASAKTRLPKNCGRGGRRLSNGTGSAEDYFVPSFIGIVPFPDGNASDICGGTILSRQLVLTSAKCINRYHGSAIKNLATLTSVQRTISKPEEFNSVHRWVSTRCVSKRHHDMFSHASHDIAILQLDRPLNFSNLIQPACLPDAGEFNWPTDNISALRLTSKTIKSLELAPPFPISVDIKITSTAHPIAERDCPNEKFHPSIVCSGLKSKVRAASRAATGEQEPECWQQGAPVMGGLKPGGKHTVYGVISQPGDEICSDSPSIMQAANLLHLRREILELIEECSLGLE